jgi:hypothetical protein
MNKTSTVSQIDINGLVSDTQLAKLISFINPENSYFVTSI